MGKMWLKIKVLIWKSLRLRKRHWIGSIFEITIPILLFIFLVYLNTKLAVPNNGPITVNASIPDPIYEEHLTKDFIDKYSANSNFIYTPKNKKTEQVMLNVMGLLEIFPNHVTTTNSESEMITQFINMHNSSKREGFGIVFIGSVDSKKFTYKIRSTNEVWNTDLLFPTLEVPGPMDSGETYFKTGFLALQLALDKSFIQVNNPEAAKTIQSYNFAIQSYPYAKYIIQDITTIFQLVLPMFTVISFLLMCSYTIQRVVEEKESGVKELMKMMGLKSWMIWAGWLLHNIMAYLISVVIIVWLCCVRENEEGGKLLNHTNPLLFGVFLMVYIISGIFFSFAVSGFFSRPILATNIGVLLWLVSYSVPSQLLKSAGYKIKLFSMLLPNMALFNGYTSIASLETQGYGLQFSTIFVNGKNDEFSVGLVLLMLILDSLLYAFIAWFMDCVKPGQYGIAKPINFLCTWSKSTSEDIVKIPVSKKESKLFEKVNAEYEVGIDVQNLYKSFGNCHAVNGVNLQIYKGQITALLGHNGAGKTTTMSIITGMYSPTNGSVAVNGRDIFNNLDKFRESLGLCPQHNLLFSYLTVFDHLLFFGMLKGLSYSDSRSEGTTLLTLLNILDKKDQLVKSLSGGMKRKLSLAIALIGDPEILILDEPTSGMDPESRREMWDLLLSIRGKRTILITTHFMEEADVLGDRIAIMDHGQVICYGTSLFLKKAYGTGYHLTIIKNESCDVNEMTNSILKIVPEAELQSSLSAQVVYNLPSENTDQFPDLFRMLELRKEEFGITGMGVACTTMEEVFLRAGKNIQENIDDDSPIHSPVGAPSNYQLIITKQVDCNIDNVTALVKQYVPEFSLMANLSLQLVYNLPSRSRSQFSTLFSGLEFQKENLKIESIKITNPTTGDIYPKISKFHSTVLANTSDNNKVQRSAGSGDYGDEPKGETNGDVNQTLMPKYMTGYNLMKNQFTVLLTKKAVYSSRRWFLTIIFGLLPVLTTIFTMQSTYDLFEASKIQEGLNLVLSAYKDSNVYYRIGDDSSNSLESRFADISKMNQATVHEIPSSHNLIDDMLELCTNDVFKYRSHVMIAGDFNNTNTTVMFNNIAYHTPGIAVNLYTNALLQKVTGNNEMSISVTNDPIQITDNSVCGNNFQMQIVLVWLTMFSPGMLYFISYYIAMPLNERVSGFKHLQMMTKLSPVMYWCVCFIWDYICYLVVIVITMITMYSYDHYRIFTGPDELWTLLVLFIAYGWSSIFYAYSFSFFKKSLLSSISLFIAVNFILGLIINNILYLVKAILVKPDNEVTWFHIVRYIVLLVPHFSYSSCIVGFVTISWENNRCKICKTPDMEEACSGSADFKPKKYFEFASTENPDGILSELLFLIFSSLIYYFFILLMDYKVFARMYQFIFNTIVGSGVSYKDDDEDPDVGGERDKVDAAKVRTNDDAESPLLVVDGVIKKFSFKFTGVRGISFTVSPGECFGLLGVNGAGKTTTFRVLTGDTFPSNGDAAIQTDRVYKLSSSFRQYMSMIGYCPQFDALNDQLTAKETLRLMAILRGISPNNAKKHVDKWIKDLGLEEYKNRLCGTYSGGNKRKLNTAIALIGDPPVVFLDEPTSGVDPVARRNLWQLLAVSQRAGQAVVLTSHSMDECEALCNRLTIMVDGVMKCIGNIQYLKNRYGQGFTVIIKLIDSSDNNLSELKSDIERQFAPDIHLKDEHKGLLNYHITNPRVPLSDIFGHMKAIKENHMIVEDYTISDTTLEQVFIAFAKKQAIINTDA
ncbi:phospholipid-transporting ATPase ABCA3-like isoform X2 [Adelges cooleyi]|uniref:phospholipid-transporting ATPase ABCA3-like isoform X2 n=1 Tax=Adelges cooleyi TaxID=133065 RepID=UPI002180256D|nr:phospholipid-transporting ATPase ABCA3-like isoform X2 [Adelges cooleyi]